MTIDDKRLPFIVGDQIKAARLDRKLTQDEVAKRAGISRSQLAQWESKQRNPRMRNFERICYALDISPDELMHYRSDPKIEAERFEEEAASDPIGFRIKLINMLLLGLSEKGLDEIIRIANDMSQSGSKYAKQETPSA